MRLIIEAILLVLLVCGCMSVIAKDAAIMNDFGNKEFHLWWNSSVNLVPSAGSIANSTILISGIPVPCASFESDNIQSLGIENPRTSFGSITVMRFDNGSANDPNFEDVLSGYTVTNTAGTIRYQYYGNQKITVATNENCEFSNGARDFGLVHRPVCEARVRFDNYAVVLRIDGEHFNETLKSLKFQKLWG
jgi:hypothetical protein